MQKRTRIIAVIFFLLAPLFLPKTSSVYAAVVINEMLPKMTNPSHQWIELYNNGSESVSLNMWKLENSNGTTSSFIINASGIIAPHGFLVYPQTQTNITMYPEGDTIRLLDDKNTVMDSQSYPSTLGFSTTIGRTIDGGGVWAVCTTGTPEKPNTCPTPSDTPTPTQGPTNTPTSLPVPTEEAVQPPPAAVTAAPAVNPVQNVLGITLPKVSPTVTPTPLDESVIAIEVPKTIKVPKAFLVQMAIIGGAWIMLAIIAIWQHGWKRKRKIFHPPPPTLPPLA